jgi:uncharacterized protein with PQ loop repeat
VSGIEKLTGFQQHFHHMLIYMPACGLSRIRMEGKDIHLVGLFVSFTHFIYAFQFFIGAYLNADPFTYHMDPSPLLIAYSATSISLFGRFIFMYLLYTRKSTNTYSLVFSCVNIVSSSLWVTYGHMVQDQPLLVRGSSDLVLFVISACYILYNRTRPSIHPELPT